jgi:hypothetical protein
MLILIVTEVDHRNFGRALALIENAPAAYFDQCPARLLRTQLNLTAILPSDQQDAVLNGMPLNPRDLQFATGPKSQQRPSLSSSMGGRFEGTYHFQID